ncbi:MFS transporter [Photobacterium halotolerans]|uniref:MFS transporter n=1 Tax=Photobacterium halotolerans TaxID=265726 RepID=UPI0013734E74|nr:MFS transporter [Photobacterium halotolerans]NAW87326.1 MFS transporter [Photobacterium halotolerans]
MSEISLSDKKYILLAVLLAVFVVPSSISGTAIALPYISTDMNSDVASLQWVVNAFNLTFACFTLMWGKMSDVFGRKRSFVTGACLYALASAGSAWATDILWLDIFRAIAGVGGAAIFSCGSALFIDVFDGKRRTQAFALFGTTAGLGITLGPTMSGILLVLSGWQAIFILHAVVLTLVLCFTVKLPDDRVADRPVGEIDIIGSGLFVSSMFLLMLILSKGYDWGWSSIRSLMSITGSLLLFVAFVRHIRRAANPVLSLSLLSNNRFMGYILVPVVASFTFVTLLTYFPTYLTGAMQMPASAAGLMMLCLTLPVLLFPLIAGRLAAKGVAPSFLMYLSLVCMLTGGGGLLLGVETMQSVWVSGSCLFVVGTGMGLSAGLVDGEALSCVEPGDTGMAAGLLNTFRLGSEAIAVALYGSFISSALTALVTEQLTDFTTADQGDWVTAMASGNASTLIAEWADDQASIQMSQVTEMLKIAFLITNGLLLTIAAGVSVLAVLKLRKRRTVRPVQA